MPRLTRDALPRPANTRVTRDTSFLKIENRESNDNTREWVSSGRDRGDGCIHTYKGHDRGVGVCKFSPDGKWVISGGQDGRIKLWDLTAGKLLKELPCHDGPVTCIEFHPSELLVATGSADRSVKFWDLETFELVDTAGPEATGVRSMLFTPDGSTLLSGTAEFLKVCALGWKTR